MDMKEASAMTEASGLANEEGIGRTSGLNRPTEKAGESRRPVHSPSSDPAMRWAEQLREVTMRAPLRSLLAAFLVGAWIARRR
ncbi:hypothetical protein WN72_17265 [Bradyrhizobium arachidis]|uniref:Uncharacterized protein n=1 Tax=Bradyrhizobium arachidis TaxID=858423 RepID=A0AAE7NQU9_9BRAD|nr:hypothetical protein WN72_17265 [Bradyrhizobium arachidis]